MIWAQKRLNKYSYQFFKQDNFQNNSNNLDIQSDNSIESFESNTEDQPETLMEKFKSMQEFIGVIIKFIESHSSIFDRLIT